MRNISTGMLNEFSSGSVNPIILAELYFDAETLRMWTGYGDLDWNGNNYIGGGNLIGFSPIEETEDTEAKGLVASLSGIPSSLIATALLERTRGRPFRLYLGAQATATFVATEDEPGTVLTEDGGRVKLENSLIEYPYRIFSGLMDVMEFTDDAETATIRLSVESALIVGQRAKTRRYTLEDQKKYYPSDLGLEFINQLQDKEIVW